jgi:hypothetical protein
MHPDYRKMVLGSQFTRHCNEIADSTGDQTFVVARPSSKYMFEVVGFSFFYIRYVHAVKDYGTGYLSIYLLFYNLPYEKTGVISLEVHWPNVILPSLA